jgi:hypothetical protein
MTTTLASLKRNDPLPPVPAGTLECWPANGGVHIVRIERPTPADFATIVRVWPPVQPKEQ